MSIEYIDRKTGEKCIEKVYGHKALSLLYGEGLMSQLFSWIFLPILAHAPFFSKLYGYLQKRPESKRKIEPFIEAYQIDSSEFQEKEFYSFNDFFIRKLRSEVRPIAGEPHHLAAPADGRYLVYQSFQDFQIKGKTFNLRNFFGNMELTNRYKDGSMAIIRLCPSDYHRFHFPCDGSVTKPKLINGPLFSVNPIALKKRISILAENKRMLTEIHADPFGMFLYVEVGATCVGSIRQTYTPDSLVKKGDEKGYFEFGGSCIVLFFERRRIRFDEDLIKNTEAGFETRINYGESIASSN